MATIYLPDDHGDAVVINGVAYHRIGQVIHPVTHTPVPGDMLNIEAFDPLDPAGPLGPNSTYGAVQGEWTACQHAVALFEEHSGDLAWDFDDIGSVDTLVTNFFTAPGNGEIFVVHEDWGGDNQVLALGFFLDGVKIGEFFGSDTSAGLIRIQGGQAIGYGTTDFSDDKDRRHQGTGAYKFRPDVYP